MSVFFFCIILQKKKDLSINKSLFLAIFMVRELLDNKLPSFLLHPLLHWPRCYAAQCLTQCPQAYKFGLFHPYCICFVYATSLSRRNPSFRMLMAAFWSRSICKPQSQSITRILRSFISGCWLPHL